MEEHGGADITDSEEERGGGGESGLGSRMVEDGNQFIQVYILYLESTRGKWLNGAQTVQCKETVKGKLIAMPSSI